MKLSKVNSRTYQKKKWCWPALQDKAAKMREVSMVILSIGVSRTFFYLILTVSWSSLLSYFIDDQRAASNIQSVFGILSHLSCLKICVFIWKAWLQIDRKSQREREIDLPSDGSLLRWPP